MKRLPSSAERGLRALKGELVLRLHEEEVHSGVLCATSVLAGVSKRSDEYHRLQIHCIPTCHRITQSLPVAANLVLKSG
jgi:hypothetical protein